MHSIMHLPAIRQSYDHATRMRTRAHAPLTLDLQVVMHHVPEAVKYEAAQQHKEREREAHGHDKAVAEAGPALLDGLAGGGVRERSPWAAGHTASSLTHCLQLHAWATAADA